MPLKRSAAGTISENNCILAYNIPPRTPPKKKKAIMVSRRRIEEFNFFFCSVFRKKKSCESSMPRSVNKPVRCVVRTTAFEIEVTNEFCNPIANNKLHAIRSGLLFTNRLSSKATSRRINASIPVGIRYMNRSFLRDIISTSRLEKKEPRKKENM